MLPPHGTWVTEASFSPDSIQSEPTYSRFDLGALDVNPGPLDWVSDSLLTAPLRTTVTSYMLVMVSGLWDAVAEWLEFRIVDRREPSLNPGADRSVARY